MHCADCHITYRINTFLYGLHLSKWKALFIFHKKFRNISICNMMHAMLSKDVFGGFFFHHDLNDITNRICLFVAGNFPVLLD